MAISRTLYQAPKGGFLGDHIYHRYARFAGENGCTSAFDPLRPVTAGGFAALQADRSNDVLGIFATATKVDKPVATVWAAIDLAQRHPGQTGSARVASRSVGMR